MPDCPGATDGTCRGCQPAQAADGLLLCRYDTRRIGEDATTIAQLYLDLEQVLVHRRPGDRGSGAVGAPVPDDHVVGYRDAITTTLERIVARIARERGIHGPSEPYLHRLPEGVYGPPSMRRRPVYTQKALAQFIVQHVEWLAALPDAGDVAAALRELATDRRVYALAYPGPTSRQYLGDCPLQVCDINGVESICAERLYHYPSQPFILCTGCGTEETVEQWQLWLVPKAAAEVDVYAAAADLSLRWHRPVDPATIRQWHSRGKIDPVLEVNPGHPDEPCPTCPTNDDDGPCPDLLRVKRVNRRTLYPLDTLRAYARSIWSAEPAATPLRSMAVA